MQGFAPRVGGFSFNRKELIMTATRTVSKFIIALCPATPVYLTTSTYPSGAVSQLFSRSRVRADAFVFDTFDAAMEVAKDITGWGGAQRVEEIAVQIPDNRLTLDTPEARIEVRDNATAQYNAAREAGYAERNAAEEVANDLRGCGLKVAVVYREDASCAVTIALADHLGNLLDLDYDVLQDGFSYETEGDDACDIGETEAQHEDEPDTEATCLADDGPRRHDDGKQVRYSNCSRVVCNNLAPRFVDAEAGTEPIFKALLGLTTEQKIAALANALLAAQTTICRVEEDGHPIIRAILPNYHPHFGTVTVLNI